MLRFGKTKPIEKINDTKTKCMIHFVDSSITDTDKKIDGEYLTDLISDQTRDLWKKMKRGDFVYDLGQSNPFPYIVDIERDQPEHIKILRHGLVIKDPYTLWDPDGSVFPDMFTITEFPIGYFDKRDNTHPCSVWLDVAKLKLNILKQENIFIVKTTEYHMKNTTYLYIIITYKKIKYMIMSKSNESDLDDENLVDKFIEYFKDPSLTKVSDQINHKICEIAKNENVLEENILLLIIG